MVDKKKILFFMWSFSLGGGAEKILSTIVSNLDPEKYDIDILEMEHFDKGYESVPENVKISRLSPTKMVKSAFMEIENLFSETYKTFTCKRSI